MKEWAIETMSSKQVEALSPVFTKENNPYICETAGFEPLEVKFKRFEQNGIMAQLSAEMFNSHDYRDIYLDNPDFEISPEDDMEEAFAKFHAQAQYVEKLKAEKLAKSYGNNVKAGTDEPEKESAKADEAANE